MKRFAVLSLTLLVSTGLSFAGHRNQNSGASSSKSFQSGSAKSSARYSTPKLGDHANSPNSWTKQDRAAGTPKQKYNPNYINNLYTAKPVGVSPVNPYLRASTRDSGIRPIGQFTMPTIPGMAKIAPTEPTRYRARYYQSAGSSQYDDPTTHVRLKAWRPRYYTPKTQEMWRKKIMINAQARQQDALKRAASSETPRK